MGKILEHLKLLVQKIQITLLNFSGTISGLLASIRNSLTMLDERQMIVRLEMPLVKALVWAGRGRIECPIRRPTH
jgi:hypothetical protein